MIIGKRKGLIVLFLLLVGISGTVTASSETMKNVFVTADRIPLNNSTHVTITSSDEPEDLNFEVVGRLDIGTENLVVITISDSLESDDPESRILEEVIGPGEDKFYSSTVLKDQLKQYIRLSWEESTPLSLTIFPPDGELGPFEDEADGRIDNTIFLKIDADEGLKPGRWYYRVRSPEDGRPQQFLIETWEER